MRPAASVVVLGVAWLGAGIAVGAPLPRLEPEEATLAESQEDGELVAKLRSRREALDAGSADDSEVSLRLLARRGNPCGGNGEVSGDLVEVLDAGSWPAERETSYVLQLRPSGRVVGVEEVPYSCSGDWHNSYRHYFDDEGRTFAFQVYSGFHGGCGPADGTDPEVPREVSDYYFDPSGRLLAKDYSLTDIEGVPIDPARCGFRYRYPYSILDSWETYAEERGLPPRFDESDTDPGGQPR